MLLLSVALIRQVLRARCFTKAIRTHCQKNRSSFCISGQIPRPTPVWVPGTRSYRQATTKRWPQLSFKTVLVSFISISYQSVYIQYMKEIRSGTIVLYPFLLLQFMQYRERRALICNSQSGQIHDCTLFIPIYMSILIFVSKLFGIEMPRVNFAATPDDTAIPQPIVCLIPL